MSAGTRLVELLGLETAPVALYIDRTGAGAPKTAPSVAAGCVFWPMAAAGAVLRTQPEHHLACPVGAHTHGIDMPPGREAELTELIGTMSALEYLDPAEVPALPRLPGGFRALDYAPFDGQKETPDVVIVRGTARQIMLLAEAARAAGVLFEDGMMGRPACAAVPATLATGRMVTSLGCIGNRVYTGLGDGELYGFLPGARAAEVVARLETIARANRELEVFHRARAAG